MPTHWRTWTWLLIVGSIHVYILYSSIHRYVNLKHEVFNGFLVGFKDYQWILSLLNCQLYVIIASLGLFPLWVYSTIFSSSSFLCGSDLFLNRKGFYQLVWDEALTVLARHIRLELSGVDKRNYKCCQGNVKIAVFFPISSLLHVLMAYLFILPLPYTEAWLAQTNDQRQENIWSGIFQLELFGSNNLILKVNHSVEYFNFFLSLLSLSIQFSKILWLCNKSFAIFLNSIQIMVTIHILVNFSLFSVFIKFYYKERIYNSVFLNPCFTLLITSISDAMLIFTSFSYFQFGFEKCVHFLLTSSWFNGLNRPEAIPLANSYEQSNCQSMTSSSAVYSPRSVVDKKNSLCPTVTAAGLFLLGMGMKSIGCYQYWYHIQNSRYLMAYVIHSSVLVVAYFLIWFGMCLKPDWRFKLTEKQLSQYSIITYPEKTESNYYKSLKSQQGNSQISLSVASNTNGSVQSKRKDTFPRLEYTSHNPYMSPSMSLNLPASYKLTAGTPGSPGTYLPLNNHINQANAYNSIYACNSLSGPASPTITNYIYKDFRKAAIPSYSILRSNDSTRSDESDEHVRKLKKSYTIHEEINNEMTFSSADEEDEVFLDSAHSLLKYNDQLKNNSQMKFVTFQLDKNADISADIGSSTENLTILSLDASDKFINELESGTSFKGDRDNKDSVNSLYFHETSGKRHLDTNL